MVSMCGRLWTWALFLQPGKPPTSYIEGPTSNERLESWPWEVGCSSWVQGFSARDFPGGRDFALMAAPAVISLTYTLQTMLTTISDYDLIVAVAGDVTLNEWVRQPRDL